MKLILVFCCALATVFAFAESGDNEHPPEPPHESDWRDDGGPGWHDDGGPGAWRDHGRPGAPGDHGADAGPRRAPEPRNILGFRPETWIVGGIAAIPCLLLLVLLVREMTRGRREAATKLSLLASVSHEFRTPLTSLRLYAELLESSPELPAIERNRYLGIISDETARLARLVDNVLDYGRLAENRRVYALRELDLPRLVRDIIVKQEAHAAAAGMTLTLSGDAERTARGDADAVRQVVNNLIDNAVKYAAPGKVIGLAVGIDEGCPYIEVADRGPGIAKENVRRLFNRFWRADASLASGVTGAGLGLNIARGLMRGMGGDLVYRANPEGGSIFRAVFHG